MRQARSSWARRSPIPLVARSFEFQRGSASCIHRGRELTAAPSRRRFSRRQSDGGWARSGRKRRAKRTPECGGQQAAELSAEPVRIIPGLGMRHHSAALSVGAGSRTRSSAVRTAAPSPVGRRPLSGIGSATSSRRTLPPRCEPAGCRVTSNQLAVCPRRAPLRKSLRWNRRARARPQWREAERGICWRHPASGKAAPAFRVRSRHPSSEPSSSLTEEGS